MDNTNDIIRKFEPILDELNLVELRILNQMVVSRINFVHKAGTLMHMAQFNIGDKVSWLGRNGLLYTGTVIRLNQKTVSVKAIGADEGHWNISPNFLRKEV
jgi:hypothetical protein